MIHRKQGYYPTCGACSYGMIVDIPQDLAVIECKTKLRGKGKGTYTLDVLKAFRQRKIACKLIEVDQDFRSIETDLRLLSQQYKLYVSGTFVNRNKRGKPTTSQHAFVIWRGTIYDPAEPQPFPIESYYFKFTKHLVVKEIIVVGLDENGTVG